MERCLYFGCWGRAGHDVREPGGREPLLNDERALGGIIDARYAPTRESSGEVLFRGAGHRRIYEVDECAQGEFLRHKVGKWSLIQWWDRTQGDTRPGCNSTILLEGDHTSEELLGALSVNFPSVLKNLEESGVKLVEVFLPPPCTEGE